MQTMTLKDIGNEHGEWFNAIRICGIYVCK